VKFTKNNDHEGESVPSKMTLKFLQSQKQAFFSEGSHFLVSGSKNCEVSNKNLEFLNVFSFLNNINNGTFGLTKSGTFKLLL